MSQRKEIELAFLGDLALGLGVRGTVDRYGASFPYQGTKEAYLSSQFVVANFEGFVSDRRDLSRRQASMAVPSVHAEGLIDSGINVLCLANNHIMDAGEKEAENTENFLQTAGFLHYGVGRNLVHATSPAVREKNGVRVAFVGAADFSRIHAGNNRYGVAPADPKSLLDSVALCKTLADVIVVSLHADLEFVSVPAPWRVELCRRLVDAGADLVVQHHPHVLQGVERWNEGLIAYSLGNYVFQVSGNRYQSRHEGTSQGVILKVLIRIGETRELSWELIPTIIDDEHVPRLLEGAERTRAVQTIQNRSDMLSDPNAIADQWRCRARQELAGGIADTYWALRRRNPASAMAEISRLIGQAENRRLFAACMPRFIT